VSAVFTAMRNALSVSGPALGRPTLSLRSPGQLGHSHAGCQAPGRRLVARVGRALRRQPHPGLASVGARARGPYVVDKGFEGQANQRAWWSIYGAQVLCPPKRHSKTPWPKRLRRWLAGVRQMVETVYEKLQHTFRLDRERPHDLSGFQARLAAKIALHNFCIWFNEQLGRPRLAFTDLVDW
jgi:hypothetical protein